MHSKLIGPISDASRNAIKGYDAIAASVAKLFCPSGPLAVVLRVPERVVGAFKRMFRGRPGAHVAIEDRKRGPGIAYRDATPSIVMVTIRRLATATAKHRTPGGVFGGGTFAVRCDATARAAAASVCSERTASDFTHFPACATTEPVARATPLLRFCQNGPLTESSPGQVYKAIAATGRIGCAHQTNLHIRFGRWEGPNRSRNLRFGPCHFTRSCAGGQAHAA